MTAVRDRLPNPPLAAVWLVAAVLLIYLPSCFTNQWVIDDYRFIVNNAFLESASGLGDWLRIFSDPYTADPTAGDGIVRPLRTASFLLDLRLFGPEPIAFHLHSLAWHCAAVLLGHRLLTRLVGPAAAFWGALVWALHPMQVESVAWVSSRGDLAMGAFTIGALLLELRSRGRDSWLAGALAAGLIALLWKETAVVLPLLVVAVHRFGPDERHRMGLRDALVRAVPYLVVVAAYLVYRQSVLSGPIEHTRGFVLGGSTAGTFATMFRGFAAYVGFAALPVAPANEWYLPVSTSLLSPTVLLCLALHVALIVGAWRWRVTRPVLALCAALFYVPLIPVANWPFQLGIPTAERFLYLSLLGLALLVATLLRRAPRAWPAVALAVLACGVGSVVRTADWKDDAAAQAVAARHGRSPQVHALRAVHTRLAALEAQADGDDEAAQRLFESALASAHASLDLWHEIEVVSHSRSHVVLSAHTNAADLCIRLGRPGEALWHADQCAAIGDAIFPQTQLNRARALVDLRRGPAARRALIRLAEVTTEFKSAVALGRRAVAMAGHEHKALFEAGAPRRIAGGPPEGYRAALESADLTDFQRAACHEEIGEEQRAAELFASAIAAGGLEREQLERATLAIRRIREGCPDWRDHGLGGDSER